MRIGMGVWTPLLRRAGLRSRKPHTLRHAFASLLIEAGEPPPVHPEATRHHADRYDCLQCG